jgi:hypothetical protein
MLLLVFVLLVKSALVKPGLYVQAYLRLCQPGTEPLSGLIVRLPTLK